MSTTPPERVALGATTLARKWYLDVNTGSPTVKVWTPVCGITEMQPATDPTLQDDSDYDSQGWKSQTKTANAWSLTGKVRRGVTIADPEAYDPGQEAIRLAADENGTANTIEARWYEMEPEGPRVEAYRGYAAVSWSPDGGGMDALDMVSFTLTGQGKRIPITHPDA